MYAEGHKVTNARRLPLDLLDALRGIDGIDTVLREGLGDELTSAPTSSSNMRIWNKYSRHLTEGNVESRAGSLAARSSKLKAIALGSSSDPRIRFRGLA